MPQRFGFQDDDLLKFEDEIENSISSRTTVPKQTQQGLMATETKSLLEESSEWGDLWETPNQRDERKKYPPSVTTSKNTTTAESCSSENGLQKTSSPSPSKIGESRDVPSPPNLLTPESTAPEAKKLKDSPAQVSRHDSLESFYSFHEIIPNVKQEPLKEESRQTGQQILNSKPSIERTANSATEKSPSKSLFYVPKNETELETWSAIEPQITKITADLKKTIEKDPHKFTTLFYPKGMNVTPPNGALIANWKGVQHALEKVVQAPESGLMHLKDIIQEYGIISKDACNFVGVENDQEITSLFIKQLPSISRHAIQLPERLSTQIPPLKNGENRTFYLSRNLACSLVAHAVLCTITSSDKLDGLYPDFNFLNLYNYDRECDKTDVKKEKLKCFLEYFNQMERMPESESHNIISFERQSISTKFDWINAKNKLCDVRVDSKGKIGNVNEVWMLETGFTSRRVGGGVLCSGAEQQELPFCVSPELLCALLFAHEPMGNDEVFIMTGAKVFCSYTGYGSTFKFQKLVEDPWKRDTKKDSLGRGFTQVVVMGALNSNSNETRIPSKVDVIDQELDKNYVGFSACRRKTPVVSDCINGDPELKFLVQWMVASVTDRPSIKFFVKDESETKKFREIAEILKKNNVGVGSLYKFLCDYVKDGVKENISWDLSPPSTMFEYIEKTVKAYRKSKKGILSSLLK